MHNHALIRRVASAFGAALWCFSRVAFADDGAGAAGPAAQPQPAVPAYTLEVDSDAPEVLGFESIEQPLAAELSATVGRPGAMDPKRARLVLTYRRAEGTLRVRALPHEGAGVDRTVPAGISREEIQRTAVLLAANAARDEAADILRSFATPAPATAPAAAPITPSTRTPIEDEMPVSFGFLYPVAMNYGKPNVVTWGELSAIYGHVGRVKLVQLDGVMAFASQSVRGVQLGGSAAWSRGDVDGVQVGGAMGVAGGVRGLQLSGAASVALGKVDGAQISGAAAVAARGIEGLQLSGVNYAEHVVGAQVGVLNIAGHVRGAQVGLVNIARKVDGAAIGLVSLSENSVHPIVWGGNLSYVNAGVRFSTQHVYTLLALGFGNPETRLTSHLAVSAGLGGHWALSPRFDIEAEGQLSYLSPDETIAVPKTEEQRINTWVHPRLQVGYRLAPRLRVYSGAGARIPLSVDLGESKTKPELLMGVEF